jgi:hypothetical protein
MTMVSNDDLETICRRIGKQVERSWSILYTVCDRLNKQPFEGSRDNFYASFGKYSSNTMAVMVEALMRKGVVVPRKDGASIVGYRLDEIAIFSMLATNGPDPTRHKTNNVRGSCGHMAVELYNGVCYGCHIAAMVNRQRKGKCRV